MNSFPIDPDANTVQNCTRRVTRDADALVLVIGGRYGYASTPTGRSVTNLEYLTARAKGIPVYAFVRGEVLAQLVTWQRNPDADFSGVVDDPRVFGFIREVREEHSVWMQAFRVARDITSALQQQFAYRMTDGLALLRQLRGSPQEYAGFSGSALQIALERPTGWLSLLLAQLVEDEIARSADLRLAYDLNVAFGPGERIAEEQMVSWQASVLDQGIRLGNGLEAIINRSLAEAMAAPDGVRIASCARIIGEGYREALRWAIDLRRAHVPEDWRPVVRELSLFTRDMIEELERIPALARDVIARAIEGIARGEEPSLDAVLRIRISNFEPYQAAMDELRRRRGL
jgi:hypothetical protein